MPSGMHKMELNIPIRTVWEFVSDMNNWAPLVPGYMEHEILNESQSTWKFRGDIGAFQKNVHLQIDIIEWQEPSKVTFHLKGLNEKFSGGGYFKAEAISRTKTYITGTLEISAGGMLGPMINPILRSYVPKTTSELTAAIANKLSKLETVAK